MAIVRMGLSGTRALVLIDHMKFIRFLSRSVAVATLKAKVVFRSAKAMSGEQMKHLVDAFPGAVLWPTLGVHDAVFVPSGWIFHERVQTSKDYIGTRFNVFCMEHSGIMGEITRHLTLTDSANEKATTFADSLALVKE